MKPLRIVLAQPLCRSAMALLEQEAEVLIADSCEIEHLAPLLSQADGLIFRYGSITRELLACGSRLRVVAKPGVGYDGIALEEATRRGIPVALCPPLNANAVAEHTLMLMLACAKNLLESVEQTRIGNYQIRSAYRSCELRGKTVAVCGFGHIGRRVAELCRGMGMRVVVFSRHAPESETAYEFRQNLYDAIADADIVTLHLPSNKQTRRLFDGAALEHMKQGAILINTARGDLVDYAALLRLVEDEKLSGAGLDFLETEPVMPDNPLLKNDRIIVTPHMAALAKETAEEAACCIVKATIEILHGNRWDYVANPEVYCGKQQNISPAIVRMANV